MKFAAARFKDPHRGDHWTADAMRHAPGFVPVEDTRGLEVLSPWGNKAQATRIAEITGTFVAGAEEV